MSDSYEAKDSLEVVHHDPQEGFDPTEPDTARISFFVIGSIILLVMVIVALQRYFVGTWDNLVYERVLSAPSAEVATQRSLSEWRLNHYEYTTPARTQVRLPLDRAKELFLQEAAAGTSFYPGKATAPKAEEPLAEAAVSPAAAEETGKNKGK